MQSDTVLLFVYNSDRGDLAAIKDYSKKSGSDKIPSCNLTSLVLTPVGMKKSWKRFINELPVPARFLHRDEFEGEFGALKFPAPAVFIQSGKVIQILVTAEEINLLDQTDDLITFVGQRFQQSHI